MSQTVGIVQRRSVLSDHAFSDPLPDTIRNHDTRSSFIGQCRHWGFGERFDRSSERVIRWDKDTQKNDPNHNVDCSQNSLD
jgi:hypothetical protein